MSTSFAMSDSKRVTGARYLVDVTFNPAQQQGGDGQVLRERDLINKGKVVMLFRIYTILVIIFSIILTTNNTVLAVEVDTQKSVSSFDYISDVTACIASCPLFDFACYANCAKNLLPTPPPLPIPGGSDLVKCAQGCLSNPNLACLANCLKNVPPNLAQCVLGCGLPPDMNCITNQCENNIPQPPSNPKNPPKNPTKPPSASTTPIPNQPTTIPSITGLPLPKCIQLRGYCSTNRNCTNNFEYNGNTYECPYGEYCCESKNILPSLTPVPTITPIPTIDVNRGINCEGDYSVTVQGCKKVLFEFCEWRTVTGTETLCVQPSDCNITTCNNQLALIGPNIAAQKAAEEGAYIKPGTFSGYCSNVQNKGTACNNPIITSSSLNLNNPQDWSTLIRLIKNKRISDLEVLKLIHEVIEKGTYTPGLQFKTTN